MIGAMDLSVAILATPSNDTRVGHRAAGQVAAREQVVHVANGRMALLTQNRASCHKQLVVIRAMRRVTVRAGIAHGRMFEQKRTSFLSVALITGLIDRIGA